MKTIVSLFERSKLRNRFCICALGFVAWAQPTPAQAQTDTVGNGARLTHTKDQLMTTLDKPNAGRATSATRMPAEEIRPFFARVSDEAIMDLRRRLQATRWPDKETVVD